MRDIARDFRALPLVSWMVWIATAVIANPVMALTTEDITSLDRTPIEADLASNAIVQASQVDLHVDLHTDISELLPIGQASESALADPGIAAPGTADEQIAATTDETPAAAPNMDVAPENIDDINGFDDPDSEEHPDSESTLLVQATSDDLANPSDPFDFDERGVEPAEAGTLEPLMETEVLPTTSPDGDIELGSGPLTPPSLKLQTAAIQEGDEFSARARVYGHYFLEPNVAVVGAVDLSTGRAFSDTDTTGFSISELFVVASPPDMPELRGAVGLIELSSFFDRNSFAKDSLTHFINPVFQTNPALATTQLESQPAALIHWRPVDEVILKAAAFSSGGFNDLDFDAVAGEIAFNVDNLIIRGTYVSATDDGDRDGIPESFQINRNGVFGPREGDREVAYGINAEWFIPEINAGLFGRYGHHRNADLDISGNTYSFGVNFLDLFIEDDRFGIGYGRQLSDDDRRQGDRPDVLETFYDIRLAPNARAAVSWQLRDEFSESVIGFRIRADWDLLELFD